jgi:hypothetical protein
MRRAELLPELFGIHRQIEEPLHALFFLYESVSTTMADLFFLLLFFLFPFSRSVGLVATDVSCD